MQVIACCRKRCANGPKSSSTRSRNPGRFALTFRSPQPGTILIFPDEEGKVLVRPWGLALHGSSSRSGQSACFQTPSGQRVDQTDFGLLIRNIGRSMDGGRRGPLQILDEDQYVRIRVLAENHFREGKVTRYQFTIDKNTYLPAEIEEWTLDGVLERKISFQEPGGSTRVFRTAFSSLDSFPRGGAG